MRLRRFLLAFLGDCFWRTRESKFTLFPSLRCVFSSYNTSTDNAKRESKAESPSALHIAPSSTTMIPRPWTMRGLPSWVLAWWSLGLLALLVNANPDDDEPHYVSSWDSSPFNLKDVTDNNLGLMAKACSESYCHAGINGLDLWESLVEVRHCPLCRMDEKNMYWAACLHVLCSILGTGQSIHRMPSLLGQLGHLATTVQAQHTQASLVWQANLRHAS